MSSNITYLGKASYDVFRRTDTKEIVCIALGDSDIDLYHITNIDKSKWEQDSSLECAVADNVYSRLVIAKESMTDIKSKISHYAPENFKEVLEKAERIFRE